MNSIQRLSHLLRQLPGIGPKAADRIVWWLVKQPETTAQYIATALQQLHSQVQECARCRRYSERIVGSEEGLCEICRNPQRDQSLICVVGESNDTAMIQATNNFHGAYHVLGGYLDPLEGVTALDIAIDPLLKRLLSPDPEIKEVILALNADLRGETTALYLKNLLKTNAPAIKVTTLARGLPSSALIEYADELTLSDALKGRREI